MPGAPPQRDERHDRGSRDWQTPGSYLARAKTVIGHNVWFSSGQIKAITIQPKATPWIPASPTSVALKGLKGRNKNR